MERMLHYPTPTLWPLLCSMHGAITGQVAWHARAWAPVQKNGGWLGKGFACRQGPCTASLMCVNLNGRRVLGINILVLTTSPGVLARD